MIEDVVGFLRGSSWGRGSRAMVGSKLIGDIGGTNARFAISKKGGFDHLRVLPTGSYASMQDAARAYIAGLPSGLRPSKAALAVAGPISGGRATLTNSGWSFSIEQAQSELDLANLIVVNDFEATALAIQYLRVTDREVIGTPVSPAYGPIGVIGPGTGLGVATLVPTAGGWLQVPGEGGHATMAPATCEEGRILDLLRDRFGHVSAERILSGPGLENLYQAVCELGGVVAQSLSATEISASAVAGRDRNCARALDLFCAMLGTVAGNLALTVGATGGVYIGGGILPRLKQHFAGSGFRPRFEEKGTLSPYVKAIPTYLILHPHPALLGLANYAM
jgi:glucokinase